MKKSKLFLSLLSMCFALAVLCFGVYAAGQVNYTLSGSVSYEVSDAYVTVTTRVYKGAYRSAEDVYESIEGMAFDGDVPGDYDYTLDTDITIPNYSSLTTNADFEQEDIDISMNSETAVYVFEITITNIGDINVWVEPKPNWSETLNIYQADSGVTTELAQDETVKTYIILAVDNPIASVVGGDYSVGVNIGTGDCPINNEYYSFEEEDGVYNINSKTPPVNVVIPSFVNEIQVYSVSAYFCEGFSYIESIYIPGSIQAVYDDAFYDVESLTAVRIEKGYWSDNDNHYSIPFGDNPNLTYFRFPNNFRAQYTFGDASDYNLDNIYLRTLYSLDDNGVATGSKGVATASDGITKIIFSGIKGLKVLDLSNVRVDKMIFDTFYKIDTLEEVVLPSALTQINNATFSHCTKLSEITLPFSILSIGEQVFNECTSLETINFTGTIAQWNSITKGEAWNNNVPATVVHCSDGEVDL